MRPGAPARLLLFAALGLSSAAHAEEPPYPEGPRLDPPNPPASEGRGGLHWVWVPPGRTTIGDEQKGYEDEKPTFGIQFDQGFFMLESEVSRAQWWSHTHSGRAPSRGDRPQVELKWGEARAFCRAIGGDLPTEFQYEHAARAGGQGPWGRDPQGAEVTESTLARHAVFEQSSPTRLSPVKSRLPNAFGLYDLWGNAWEWSLDSYHKQAWQLLSAEAQGDRDGYLFVQVQADPPLPHTIRGGGVNLSPWFTRSAFRSHNNGRRASRNVGFRCVAGPSPSPIALPLPTP